MANFKATAVTPVPSPSAFKNMKNLHFRSIPEQTQSFHSRTIIVTGANTGLGFEACKILISLDASRIIMACRSTSKGEAARSALLAEFPTSKTSLEVVHLDMSSYDSVLAFTERVKQEARLDAAILNAGIWPTTFKLTQGHEEGITTNVISTTLLACLLHPILSQTAKRFQVPTHITIVSSALHMSAKFAEADERNIFRALDDPSTARMADRYKVCKLLVIFAVREMAKLAPYEKSGVVITANAPGFCKSNLQHEKQSAFINFMVDHVARPAHVGARALVFGAACDPGYHGLYTPDNLATVPGGRAAGKEGEELQARVWRELSGLLEGVKKGVTTL